MPRSKPHLLRILLLAILAVATGPIYFLRLFDTSGTATFSSPETSNPVVPLSSFASATSRIQKASSTSSSPLRLILHVGLPKTATSAIQCRLSDMERHDVLSEVLSAKIVEVESCRTAPFLHKVRIEQYLENFPLVPIQEIRNQSLTSSSSKYTTYERVIKGSSALQHCLDVWIKLQPNTSHFVPDCWRNSYQKYIRNHHERGYSIFIISNENLALPSFGRDESTPETCGNLFHNLLHSLGNTSEIDIVLTQRLHFDRMISMFGQEYDGEKFFTRPRLKKWPQEGGDAIPFLEDYIRDFPLERFARAMKCFRYASQNPQIRFKVLDFHNKKTDVVTAFVNVVTRNNTLPPRLVDGHWTLGTENMAMERDSRIHYDRIAVALKDSGLLPKSATRNDIRNAVSNYIQEKGLTTSDLKLKCPSETFYADLIKATAVIHQMSFPEEPGDILRRKLRMFDYPQFRDLYCEVDGNVTLHDAVMQSFLAQYKN